MVEEIIRRFHMQPLPEGGWFAQGYRSEETLPPAALPSRFPEGKPFGTAILYLLAPGNFSALHRLPSDEIYHFYLGDPVEMLLLLPDGTSARAVLGQDILAGQQVQFLVPRGAWQGSALLPGGRFALLGTTMAPGFTDSDLELGDRASLTAQFSGEEEAIAKLTRG